MREESEMSALRLALSRFSWKALPAAARSSQRVLAPAGTVSFTFPLQ